MHAVLSSGCTSLGLSVYRDAIVCDSDLIVGYGKSRVHFLFTRTIFL